MSWTGWADMPINMPAYWRGLVATHRVVFCDAISEATPLGKSVMDFGCGPGATLAVLHLKRPDLRLLGVDVNREALEIAASMQIPNTTFLHLKTDTIPEPITAHTFASLYTLCYLDEKVVSDLLNTLPLTVRALVILEPHFSNPDWGRDQDPGRIYSWDYAAMLPFSWEYHYEALFSAKHAELHQILVARR